MAKITFHLIGYAITLNVNLFQFYATAAVFLLYIVAGLLWMFRDLFRENDAVSLCGRMPRAGKHSRLWKGLFTFFTIAGFIVFVCYFTRERVAAAILVPVPFFLLARAVSSPAGEKQRSSSKRTEIIILVLLIASAAVMRCYDISNYPPGLAQPDELKLGNDVNEILEGSSIFGYLSFGPPRVTTAPLALLQKLLPRSRATLRSYTILCGILSIPAFYCLTRAFFPLFIARLSALLLVFSPYHNFYSRLELGARMTIFEIISLYFLITAIHKRSYSRIAFAAAGIAILQYGYSCARIMPVVLALGLFIALLRGRIRARRAILYGVVATGVMLVLLLPLYLVWKQHPNHPFFSLSGKGAPVAGSISQLMAGIRSCFLMFQDAKYGQNGVWMQANSTWLPLPLIALLFGGLVLVFTVFDVWPALFVGLCFLLSLSPSFLSSKLGMSHRTVMVIPFMYLLVGYGLWMLSRALRVFAGRAVACWGLVIIVVWCSAVGGRYFFGDMWNLSINKFEYLYDSSTVRATEAAWELSRDGYRIFTSRQSKLWTYLSNVPLKSLWDEYEKITFRPVDWLPENWDYSKRAIVLTKHFDEPIFGIMTKWAWLYSWKEEYFPIGKTKLLIGTIDESTMYRRETLSPKSTLLVKGKEGFNQWDGSLMLADAYELTLTGYAAGAELYIDGEPWFTVGKKAVLAAGLHDVRITSPVADESARCIREPYFDFDVREPIADSVTSVQITPSLLYSIPVYGWVHTAYPADEPSRTLHFAVEPFIFYNSVVGKKRHYPSKKLYVHEWRSEACLEDGEILPLELTWRDGDVEVYVDGKEMPRHPTHKLIAFELRGSGQVQTVLIRCKTKSNYWIFSLRQSKLECPPYEAFCPPAADRFRPAE